MVELEDVVVVANALLPLSSKGDDEQGWSAVAAPTSWTAARTVEHVVDALLFLRRAGGSTGGQAPARAARRPGRAPSEQLDNVLTAAHLLTGQLRDLGTERAWHPSGTPVGPRTPPAGPGWRTFTGKKFRAERAMQLRAVRERTSMSEGRVCP